MYFLDAPKAPLLSSTSPGQEDLGLRIIPPTLSIYHIVDCDTSGFFPLNLFSLSSRVLETLMMGGWKSQVMHRFPCEELEKPCL